MAADQERNERIAKALGWRKYKVWFDENNIAHDCLPDFSTPEWQIKIQERVRELCGETYEIEYHYYVQCEEQNHILRIYRWAYTSCGYSTRREEVFFKDYTAESVFVFALRWLAEREVE